MEVLTFLVESNFALPAAIFGGIIKSRDGMGTQLNWSKPATLTRMGGGGTSLS